MDSSLLNEEGYRPPRSPSSLAIGERHAEHVKPNVLDARRSIVETRLHVPELGVVRRVGMRSFQQAGRRGTLLYVRCTHSEGITRTLDN